MSNISLSILIPTFHTVCVKLVESLQAQAQSLGIDYEIIVADDGTTCPTCIAANRAIANIAHCRIIERGFNAGRAAIRNFLAQQASHAYLLYIDSDMTLIRPDFLQRYLDCLPAPVVDGGVCIQSQQAGDEQLLRYLYEQAEAPHHTASVRQRNPYQHLRTTNLLVSREVMLTHPFDERLRHYGYEDVLLGKTLHRHHIPIRHIDNPMGFCCFETNAEFIEKTEEGLRTLYAFRNDLRGYSRLLTFVQGIHIPAILWLIRLWHRLFGAQERRNLCGFRPHLSLFKIYRLGYYLSLVHSER